MVQLWMPRGACEKDLAVMSEMRVCHAERTSSTMPTATPCHLISVTVPAQWARSVSVLQVPATCGHHEAMMGA